MSIPTGFFTNLTKDYYGINPASQVAEEAEASSLLWKEFLSRVNAKDEPYFSIISSANEAEVQQALITIASTYMTPLSSTAVEDLGHLAHELVINRGTALSNLTSKDFSTVKDLLTSLVAPYIQPPDSFLSTLLPSIAEDLATKSGEEQKLYLDFLSGQLEVTRLGEASNALSLGEISNRQITYTLFDILLTLINLMMQSQLVEGQSETPLLQKKREYLALLKKIPVYRGVGEMFAGPGDYKLTGGNVVDITGAGRILPIYMGDQGVTLTKTNPSTDPEKFDLGYGNITVQDIFEYLYNTIALSNPPTAFTFFELPSSTWRVGDVSGKTIYATNRCYFTISRDTAGNFIINTEISRLTRGLDGSTWDPNFTFEVKMVAPPETVVPSSRDKTKADIMAALKKTFNYAYLDANAANMVQPDLNNPAGWTTPYEQDQFNIGPTNPDKVAIARLAELRNLKIEWPYGPEGGLNNSFVDILVTKIGNPFSGNIDNARTYLDLANKTRSGLNKNLNTFREAIKARMALVGDKIDAQTDIQEISVSAQKQTVNILQTLIRQLQNLISSIYR